MKKKLSDFSSMVFSQWGEDGLIEKIFTMIKPQSKVCIEFGAWDGFHFSNTANLWANNGWKGILIEGVQQRFSELQENTKEYDCICVKAFVAKDGENSLEAILLCHNMVDTIDLLSIDIDGNDYYIFESLESLRPNVIVCEYNPTIPAQFDVYQEYGDENFGCSVSALVRVAQQKGYMLVAITETNCFFVLNKYQDLFSQYECSLDLIRIDKFLTFIMTSYGGDYKVSSGALPYGCNFPSKATVHGNVEDLHFKLPALRVVYKWLRKIKSYLRYKICAIKNR